MDDPAQNLFKSILDIQQLIQFRVTPDLCCRRHIDAMVIVQGISVRQKLIMLCWQPQPSSHTSVRCNEPCTDEIPPRWYSGVLKLMLWCVATRKTQTKSRLQCTGNSMLFCSPRVSLGLATTVYNTSFTSWLQPDHVSTRLQLGFPHIIFLAV